ncbi:hypothetical protein ABZ746_30085 [Streptomyces sp. NPDC020096]
MALLVRVHQLGVRRLLDVGGNLPLPGDVQQQDSIAQVRPGPSTAARSHRHFRALTTGKPHSRHHIVRAVRPGDHRRKAVQRARMPGGPPSGCLVLIIASPEHLPFETVGHGMLLASSHTRQDPSRSNLPANRQVRLTGRPYLARAENVKRAHEVRGRPWPLGVPRWGGSGSSVVMPNTAAEDGFSLVPSLTALAGFLAGAVATGRFHLAVPAGRRRILGALGAEAVLLRGYGAGWALLVTVGCVALTGIGYAVAERLRHSARPKADRR